MQLESDLAVRDTGGYQSMILLPILLQQLMQVLEEEKKVSGYTILETTSRSGSRYFRFINKKVVEDREI